jgi:hypothetical protein
MTRNAPRILMTFVLLSSSILSFLLDWSPNHLLSPLWHPHARFHGALLLFFLAGVALTGTWLLWRQSSEPHVAMTVVALLSASYWLPLFYIPYLLPSSTWWAGRPGAEPHIAGMVFYPNLAVAALFLLLTAIAALWAHRRPAAG